MFKTLGSFSQSSLLLSLGQLNSTHHSGCNKRLKALQTWSLLRSLSRCILFLLQDMPFLPVTTPLSKVPLLKGLSRAEASVTQVKQGPILSF